MKKNLALYLDIFEKVMKVFIVPLIMFISNTLWTIKEQNIQNAADLRVIREQVTDLRSQLNGLNARVYTLEATQRQEDRRNYPDFPSKTKPNEQYAIPQKQRGGREN